MSLYAITERNVRPILMQIISLFKTTNKAYRAFKGEEIENQYSVQKFKANFRRENPSSLTVRSFAETAISKEISIGYLERVKGLEESTTRISGYPELKTKLLTSFVQNWRLYTKSDKPSEGKAVIKDSGGGMERLGLEAASEDEFFHKMTKSRLEQIKKMLRDKNKWKGGNFPTSPKD